MQLVECTFTVNGHLYCLVEGLNLHYMQVSKLIVTVAASTTRLYFYITELSVILQLMFGVYLPLRTELKSQHPGRKVYLSSVVEK